MGKPRKFPVKQDPEKPIAAEVIASSIVEIAAGMRKINETRLTRRAIITLIHERSKVPRTQIEAVLDNLDSLETTWLKKKAV